MSTYSNEKSLLLSYPQMKKPLVKIGAIGTAFVAICCFTPLLVWFLGLVVLLVLLVTELLQSAKNHKKAS